MANVARRHHYLPVSYLAGFTEGGDKKSFLYVFDLSKRMVRRQRPRNVAVERDLHTIDMPGVPKDGWEAALGRFEATAAEAIAEVVAKRSFSEDQLNTILNFVALTMVHVPWLRNAIIKEMEDRSGRPFDQAVAQAEEWTLLTKWLADVEMGWGPGDVERFLASEPVARATPQVWSFFNMLMLQDELLKLLGNRHWGLRVAGDGVADFICSDNPVGMFHSPSRQVYETPSLSDCDAVVSLPLTRRMALVGHFAEHYGIVEVSDGLVAVINFQTLARADRYLFAASEDFISVGEDGAFSNASDVFAHVVSDPPVS